MTVRTLSFWTKSLMLTKAAFIWWKIQKQLQLSVLKTVVLLNILVGMDQFFPSWIESYLMNRVQKNSIKGLLYPKNKSSLITVLITQACDCPIDCIVNCTVKVQKSMKINDRIVHLPSVVHSESNEPMTTLSAQRKQNCFCFLCTEKLKS